MRRSQICYWTLTITALINAQCADAAIIDDASFFDSIPHTFVDFETRADGSPLPLEEGQFAFAPLNEYIPLGFNSFGMGIFWEWSADPDVQQALTAGATPTKRLGMFPQESGNYGFLFVDAPRSVGLFITRETDSSDVPMTITAHTFDGDLIESVTIEGGLIDGVAGSIEYSYVGITSDIGITALTFDAPNNLAFAYGIDDLRFSQIPSPGAAPLLVLLASLKQRRRR